MRFGRVTLLVLLVAMLSVSVYGTAVPPSWRCSHGVGVGCPGSAFGPPAVPAVTGEQWFDVVMYDWGFWIVDSTTGANESNAWNVFEGYTIHINATSQPPNLAIGGEAYHGLGVEVNATGQQLLSLAAPVGTWVSGTFLAPSHEYHDQHIWCTVSCGPGHGSQFAYILNVLPPNIIPVATATSNQTRGSAPLAIGFQGNATLGTPPYNFSWNFGDGSVPAFGAAVAHTYTLGGLYFAKLTVTDSHGYTSTSTVTITVLSSVGLTTTESVSPASGAIPLRISESIVVHGGTPPYTYAWDFGDGTVTNGSNQSSHVYTRPGIYTIATVVTDSAGNSRTVLGTARALPASGALTVNLTVTPANGSTPFQPTLTATPQGGTAPYSYYWVYGDGSTGNSSGVSPLYNLTGSYAVVVFVTDASGRAGSAGVVINVTAPGGGGGGGDDGGGGNDSLPHGNLSSPAATASNASAVLFVSPTGGGAPLPFRAAASLMGGTGTGTTASWTFGDGATATGQLVSHTYASVGTYTVVATLTDSGGSTVTANTTVVAGGLTLSVVMNRSAGEAPLGIDAGVTVTGGSGIYGVVNWNWGDGSNGTGDSAVHAFNSSTPGTFTVQATIVDSAGGRANDTATVTLTGAPTATIATSPQDPGKVPLTVTFTVALSGGTGHYASTVLWSFGDQSSTRGPPTITHVYNRTGLFEVTVYSNDSSGTQVNASVLLNVTLALPAGGKGSWTFTGVSDPNKAALIMMGLVAVTGLGLLYRRRRQPTRAPPLVPTRPPAGSGPPK